MLQNRSPSTQIYYIAYHGLDINGNMNTNGTEHTLENKAHLFSVPM
jgi:hypothetical protein